MPDPVRDNDCDMVTGMDRAEGATLRDYLVVVWRRKWLVPLLVDVATGCAYGLFVMPTKTNAAAAQPI